MVRYLILLILACYGMAFFAYGNYVQPMFFGVTVPVMPLVSNIVAIMALQGFRRGNFATSNSISYGVSSFKSVRVLCFMSFLCFQEKRFAVFALAKSFLRRLSICALTIGFYCCFAMFSLSV